MTAIRAIHTTLVALFLLFGTAGCWRSANTADDTDTPSDITVPTDSSDTADTTDSTDSETTYTDTADLPTTDDSETETTTDTETADSETTDTETVDTDTEPTAMEVPCTPGAPLHATDRDVMVNVVWTDSEGWSQAARCPFLCDPGWYMTDDLAACTHEFTARRLAMATAATCIPNFDCHYCVCGLGFDGQIRCWGSPSCAPPDGLFIDIAGGLDGLCAIREDGTLVGWGENYSTGAPPPDQLFQSLSSAYCGTDVAGEHWCWEADFENLKITDPPTVDTETDSDTTEMSCHLTDHHQVACTPEMFDNPFDSLFHPPGGLYLEDGVSAGTSIAAVEQDGTFHGWGDPMESFAPGPYGGGYMNPFLGSFSAAAIDSKLWSSCSRLCGVRDDNAVICAGNALDCDGGEEDLLIHVPDLRQLSLCDAEIHLMTNESVHILLRDANWEDVPDDRQGLTYEPAGTFQTVGIGFENACGLTTDGEAFCWGNNRAFLNITPEGSFIQLASTYAFACGLRADHTLDCWGFCYGPTSPPCEPDPGFESGEWSDIRGNNWGICGVRADGSMLCYGHAISDLSIGDPGDTFTTVAPGYCHVCGITTDGEVKCASDCQDYEYSGQDIPVAGQYDEIACGEFHTCGLTGDGEIVCWGADGGGQADVPPGTWIAVYASYDVSCGMRPDHTVACWGNSEFLPTHLVPPDVPFLDFTIGPFGVCGVHLDGTLECWNEGRLSIPLSEPLQKISGFVGLTEDGTLTYWDPDVTTPALPAGTFTDISTCGPPCGIRTDGTIECWGPDAAGYPPMEGEYLQLSTSGDFLCAVATDHSVRCFDLTPASSSPTDPTLHIPDGAFASVSVNYNQACGVRTDGTLACWGARLR